MKIIDLEQGTDEWLSWRKTVITATDCPAILGSSPWSTKYKSWARKLGIIPEQTSNSAMEEGKRLEPIAREKFIETYGIDMTPAVVESEEFNFLGASLDGLSESSNTILEIKCGGYKLHAMAEKGEIPQYYIDQMQHQLLVTGAEKCYYYSFNGKDGICIEVYPDEGFKDRFMPEARGFWRCIAFNEPPELDASDYKDMSENSSWQIHANDYIEICKEIKELEEVKEYIRKNLIELCDNQNCSGNGVKVMLTSRKGLVDYSVIPELNGVNLDQYRKKSTASWKIITE